MPPYRSLRWPLVAYSVEKLCFTKARKFKGVFRLPGARITDQLCASEVHQAGFSSNFYYPPRT
jgi:hypothetical protein